MGLNAAQKIIKAHLAGGAMTPGSEIALKVDQTLTQDATGTVAYLEFESMGISRVKTALSVSYVDHNTLQTGVENADDHAFLQQFAAKYGIYFSRPGNGICHQVHLERFGVPGQVLLGSDSHTPTGGGLGMLAIGVGGLDIALAMAGSPFNLSMPSIVKVELKGRLRPWVSAKDIILELLRRLTVKGGVGKVFEYCGAGVARLSIPERATITNMGAELGATTSLFPSDEVTRKFLQAQGRGKAWKKVVADVDARYDEEVVIDLASLEPMVARPHMPDNVVPVKSVAGKKVNQVLIGSCTNSSYKDLMTVAGMLRNRKIHPEVSFGIAPGSRQVLEMISKTGALTAIVKAGARILEVACGPCIGMGQAPCTGGVSLRTFNRNFEGRSGTPSGQVYLVSPEVATASAIKGVITDPRALGRPVAVKMPARYVLDDSMIIPPAKDPRKVTVVKGPNIASLPVGEPLGAALQAEVLIRLGDNVTTDQISPAGAKVLPLRSNVPKLAEFVFSPVDPGFAKRAAAVKEKGMRGVIVGGKNYGQGSSREHAALCPMYLGVRAVLAVSFARIHKANLVNFGILPLVFEQPADYEKFEQGGAVTFPRIAAELAAGDLVTVDIVDKRYSCKARCELSPRERKIVAAGGILAFAGKCHPRDL